MLESLKDAVSEVKESVGDKGLILLVGGVCILFVISLLKSRNSTENMEVPTGVVSYPSLEKNADVVIDTLTQNFEGALSGFTTEIMGGIGTAQDEIILNQTEEFDKVQESFANTNSMIKDNFNQTNSVIKENFDSTNTIIKDNFNATNDYINEGLSKAEDMYNKMESISTRPVVQYTPSRTYDDDDDMNMVTVSKPVKLDTYTYTEKSGLNTNQSIVDALKATGTDSSMEHRKEIAEANGITNYTGSYSQNVELLDKLKAGELKKV